MSHTFNLKQESRSRSSRLIRLWNTNKIHCLRFYFECCASVEQEAPRSVTNARLTVPTFQPVLPQGYFIVGHFPKTLKKMPQAGGIVPYCGKIFVIFGIEYRKVPSA